MCCSSKFEINSLLLHFCWFWWNFDQTINSIWRSLSLRCSHKIPPENFRKFLFSENVTHAARLRRHSLVYASSVDVSGERVFLLFAVLKNKVSAEQMKWTYLFNETFGSSGKRLTSSWICGWHGRWQRWCRHCETLYMLPSVQTFNRITLVRVCLSPFLYCISPFICSFDWAGLCEYT